MSYSNKENINILTALLVAKGIKRAVVCPGSRNAPIVHNLSQVMDCTPITDERSAGFYALGMAQASGQPVVVCVTSGSALLNVMPAAAEAFYQRVPIIIVSADRPQRWIDQQDGQTLWQVGALDKFVRKTVCLPEEASSDEEHWHCNRLVNEALMAAADGACFGPVHINVPLSEPLYDFTVKDLPAERLIKVRRSTTLDSCAIAPVLKRLVAARHPMVVVGQMTFMSKKLEAMFNALPLVLLTERLTLRNARPFDAIIPQTDDERAAMAPDFVLYMGGTLVSKRLRQFLRQCPDTEMWEVSATGEPHDTFKHQSGIIVCSEEVVIESLTKLLQGMEPTAEQRAFIARWNKRMCEAEEALQDCVPFSSFSVVRDFERQLELQRVVSHYHEHYANSTAVRLGCALAHQKIWCNRGVNGIEGSISTAAGFSLVVIDDVFCVTGDLSFFYDQNALWCNRLKGNLRILLLNNGGGGIFHKFPINHEEKSFPFIVGDSTQTAQGICGQNDIDYLAARNEKELAHQLDVFLNRRVRRAMVLEVFTKPDKVV